MDKNVTMENITLPHHDRREGDESRGISLTTGNTMGSDQQDSSLHVGKAKEDGNDRSGGYQNPIGEPVPIATPTPTSFANARSDIRSQMRSLLPPLPLMTTPPQTPIFANTVMGIGSWKVSTPPSVDALRAMYQSSRRSGTTLKGITPMYHPGTFPPMQTLYEPPNVDTTQMQFATMLQNQQLSSAFGSDAMKAPANANTLLEEDWASLFRNISTGDVALRGHAEGVYAAHSRTDTTDRAVEAPWQMQRPLHFLDSVTKEKESKDPVIGFQQQSEDDSIMEPPAKKSKMLGTYTFTDTEEYLKSHLIDRASLGTDGKHTILKNEEDNEHEYNVEMNEGEKAVNVGHQDETHHLVQQPKQTQVRSEREQHIISRKIQRLLLIRHCSTCTVPISPPPPPPSPHLAIPCPPLAFPLDFCAPCNVNATTKDHSNTVAVCPVTSHCAEGKALCAHILSCKLKDCTYRGCLTTREVLGHHIRCRDEGCEVCGPVRLLDQKRRHSYQRRKDKDDAKMRRSSSSIDTDEDGDVVVVN